MRLLPRDEKFFDLFSAVAGLTVEAARLQQVPMSPIGALSWIRSIG